MFTEANEVVMLKNAELWGRRSGAAFNRKRRRTRTRNRQILVESQLSSGQTDRARDRRHVESDRRAVACVDNGLTQTSGAASRLLATTGSIVQKGAAAETFEPSAGAAEEAVGPTTTATPKASSNNVKVEMKKTRRGRRADLLFFI